MKIISLTAENIKKLTAVHIEPNGNLVEITGRNGQGKSSVLDAIWWCLAGADNVQSMPIRKGAKAAQIRLKLGGEGRELVATRKFVSKEDGEHTTSLVVESAEGARFPKAQSVLDELLGALAFDPLHFSRMKPREQFDALAGFVPDVDFAVIEGRNKTDFERRAEVNKAAKNQRAAAEMILVPMDTPEAPIDEQALTDELKAAGVLNQDVERRTVLRARAVEDVATWRRQAEEKRAAIPSEGNAVRERYLVRIRDMEEQIARLQRQVESTRADSEREIVLKEGELLAQANEFEQKANELQGRLETAEQLPELVDVDAIAARMTKARTINANVERARLKAVHVNNATKLEAEAEQLTANIDARNQAKREAIAKAKMPVPGLDFGDGVVLLNGVPFEQASDAERLRASVAIAMAANPKLRVIRIRDGSLLDEDAMKVLEQIAIERDFQVWIERVDSSGTVGFVLEDGHVRQADVAGERSAA